MDRSSKLKVIESQDAAPRGVAVRRSKTDTLEIVDVLEEEVNDEYAILSHTWLQGPGNECTFQDILDLDLARRKPGFAKIRFTCEQALKDGLAYAWIDTCCIDKSNSAELAESINSMYRWYQQAKVCYVYLADVEFSTHVDRIVEKLSHTREDQLRHSKWFTRGWTLQELLAPPKLLFWDENWSFLGDLETLSSALAAITRIDSRLLLKKRPLRAFSTAQRLSWAAGRRTTRIEDRAYSLLGLFDLHMPIIYGEGTKAFARLQEEIMKSSTDNTIFAWGADSTLDHGKNEQLLAPSPEYFRHSHSIVPVPGAERPYQVTSRGVRITLPVVRLGPTYREYLYAILSCRHSEICTRAIALELMAHGTDGSYTVVSRVTSRHRRLVSSRVNYIDSIVAAEAEQDSIFKIFTIIWTKPTLPALLEPELSKRIWFRNEKSPFITLEDVRPRLLWDGLDTLKCFLHGTSFCLEVCLSVSSTSYVILTIGLGFSGPDRGFHSETLSAGLDLIHIKAGPPPDITEKFRHRPSPSVDELIPRMTNLPTRHSLRLEDKSLLIVDVSTEHVLGESIILIDLKYEISLLGFFPSRPRAQPFPY